MNNASKSKPEVVDFIDAYASWPPLANWLAERFGTVHWPTFNVADSAITIVVPGSKIDGVAAELAAAQVQEIVTIDDPALASAQLAVSRSPVMLVGHLPHINRLAALLVHGDAEGHSIKFIPAMIACFSREGPLWKLNWTLAPYVQ